MAKKKSKKPAAAQDDMLDADPEVHCIFSKMVDIEKVKPNPENPNVHPSEQILILAQVLRTNGWREAIIVSNRSGMVVKGHGRLQTAKAMKLRRVPVEFQDYVDNQAEYADMIADNRVAQHSYVDAFKLGGILKKISEKGQESLGYSKEERDLFLNAEYVAPVARDSKFVIMESLKMSKDEKAIVGRAVQRYCLRTGKEVEWGAALASICIEWEGGSHAGPLPPAKPEAAAAPAAAPAKRKPKAEPEPEPARAASGKVVFKVKYVAGAVVSGEDAFVIRPQDGEQGYYSDDKEVVKVARLAEVCTPTYDLVGTVVLKGKAMWLTCLEKA